MNPMDFYQSTSVGRCLIDVLNEMIENGDLPPEEATLILVIVFGFVLVI
jgi:hypothetical protein